MTLRSFRPTLIDRYIFREILPFTGLGLLLFTFVLLLPQIAELMGLLVSRNADPLTVLRIFWAFVPHLLALTIPMSVLLGVLLAFGRMGSESEVIALRAGGVGPTRLVRPVVAIALIATLVTLYITAVAYPRANQEYRNLTASLIASQARTALKPRVFTDDLLPSGGNLVLYISDVVAGSGEWRDLLIRDMRVPQKPRLVLARTARLEIDRASEEARLDLKDGAVYTFDPTQPERWEEQRFAARELLLPFQELFPAKVQLVKGQKEMDIFEVQAAIREAERTGVPKAHVSSLRVEWHMRLSIATACLVFGLLGVGLSLGQKKEARSAAFGLSIVAIFVYYVFLKFGEYFGDNGWLHPAVAMWSANILFGGMALGLLYLNQREAAFDPLEARLYLGWLPQMRRKAVPVSPTPSEAPDEIVGTASSSRRRIRLGSLLDAYVVRSYLGNLVLAATAFLSLTMLLDFMDLVDDIHQNKVSWGTLFHYLLFQAPDRLQLVLLVAFLVATLTTLGIMARRNEITAMKAGGISVYRLAVPIAAAGIAGSLLLFALGEFFVPYTNRVARRDRDVIKGRPLQSVRQMETRMLLGGRGRFYEVFGSHSTPDVLYNLWVFDVDPETWRLRECLFAARARWNRYSELHELERGWRRQLKPEGGGTFLPFETTKSREIETPKFFGQERGSGDTLSFAELHSHIQSLAAQGMDVVGLEVDLHSKLAMPAVAIVMALIGIPFSFVVGRRGALYGIGIALLVAIVYWSCFEIFRGLGVNGLLAPPLAMWAPNILFAGTAVYLLLSLDT